MAEKISIEEVVENGISDGETDLWGQILDAPIDWSSFENEKEIQEQEIQVLQSIYTDEFVLQSSSFEGLRNAFQLAVHVTPVCDKTNVECWLENIDDDCNIAQNASAGRPEETRPKFLRSESGCRLFTTLTVTHLTPVIISAVLPHSYPTADRPIFSISCFWLNALQLESVANQLDALWNENAGDSIIYIWADWVKNGLFSFLGSPLILLVDGDSNTKHQKVYIETGNAMQRLVEIMGFDFKEEEISFVREQQLCQVCMSEDVGSNFFRLKPCLHHYCHTCITDYCTMHVKDGTVGQLRCPELDCKNTISPDVLCRVLGAADYARWERLMLQRTLETMGDVVWCPRCSNPVVREGDDNLGACTVCEFTFCTDCEDLWHPGELCRELRTADNRRMVKAQRQQHVTGPSQNDLREMREQLYREYQQRAVTIESEDGTKIRPCPWCKAKVQKNGGCNKMTCRCGKYFCWLCGSRITGYDHFEGAVCQTFSRTTRVVQANVNFHDGYIAYRAALQHQGKAAEKPCPRCRHRNVKTGNLNLLKCWFCNGHFCFLCGVIVPPGKGGAHYSAQSKCIQHS